MISKPKKKFRFSMGLDTELTLILTLVVEENGESKTTSKMMENDVMLDDTVLSESTNNTDSYMFQKSDEKTKISDKKTDGEEMLYYGKVRIILIPACFRKVMQIIHQRHPIRTGRWMMQLHG